MIVQVQQLIKMALQDVGAIAKSEAPSADEASDALFKLNVMIDAWSVRRLMVLAAVMESFALVAGKASYTIGPAGDFATSKPSKITDAFIRDGSGTDSGLDILDQTEWFSITDKVLSTGRPIALYFDPGLTEQESPLGVLNFYLNPDNTTAYTAYLGEQKPLPEFSWLTDVVSFQPAYYEALEYNLAIRLWRQYHEEGRPIPEDMLYLARESMRVVENMNATQVTATIEAPGKMKPYTITQGSAV
jgi:hypothetical protein